MAATMGNSTRVLWDVIEEHLDEAEFGVGELERVLDAPEHTLADLPGLGEGRLLPQVDALAIGGDAVRDRLLLPELAAPESPQRAAATMLALLETARAEHVLPSLAPEDAAVRRAMARACAWSPQWQACARYASSHFFRAPSPGEQSLLLEILAACGVGETMVAPLLDSPHADVVASAARAARFCSEPLMLGVLQRRFDDPDSDVVESALVAALTLGSRRPLEALEAHVAGPAPARPGMLALLAVLGGPSQHASIAGLTRSPGQTASALFALGYTGNLAHVPLLLDHLDSPEPTHVKLAAQSLALLLGLDLSNEALHAPNVVAERNELPPAEEDAEALEALPAFEDDALDALPEPWPEQALPELDIVACRRAAELALEPLDRQRRHLGGARYTPAVLLEQLRVAPLRRRHNLALLLLVDSGGQAILDTRALAGRQLQQLATVGEAQLSRRYPIW
jgi:uncharacterized protein (TIGR02270 family)